MAKSTLAAILGLILAFIGANLAAMGFIAGGISALLGLVGFNLAELIAFSVVSLVAGAIMFIIGSKIALDNETPFIRLGIAGVGLYLALAAIIAFVSGTVSFGAPLFGALVLLSLGVSMMMYGIPGLKPLSPMQKLIDLYKKVLGIKK